MHAHNAMTSLAASLKSEQLSSIAIFWSSLYLLFLYTPTSFPFVLYFLSQHGKTLFKIVQYQAYAGCCFPRRNDAWQRTGQPYGQERQIKTHKSRGTEYRFCHIARPCASVTTAGFCRLGANVSHASHGVWRNDRALGEKRDAGAERGGVARTDLSLRGANAGTAGVF